MLPLKGTRRQVEGLSRFRCDIIAMGDAGFDPCECIFTHESAMRRLISLLRSSQSYCSDTECYQEFPGPENAGSGFTFVHMLGLWLVLALVLFLFRPSSLRRRGDEKPSPQNDGPDNEPPAPPVH